MGSLHSATESTPCCISQGGTSVRRLVAVPAQCNSMHCCIVVAFRSSLSTVCILLHLAGILENTQWGLGLRLCHSVAFGTGADEYPVAVIWLIRDILCHLAGC